MKNKMGNIPQAPQLDIDISQADDVCCERCGNYTFEQVILMKRLSAILSPTGKEVVVPVGPVYACNACGNINKGFLPFKPKSDPKYTAADAGPIPVKEEVAKTSLILEK